MKLAHSLTAIALITLSGLAAAQPTRPIDAAPHERAEVRHDNREVARDRHAIVQTRHELRRAQHAHEYRRVSHIRHEMYRQHKALHRDRVERRHDVRDLHHG